MSTEVLPERAFKASDPSTQTTLRLRSLVGGCVGNAIEWFDFIV